MNKRIKNIIEKRLLHLSKKAKLICRPNPAVAALITKRDKILAEGSTLAFGSKHAEIVALESFLASAKNLKDLRDVELWVTLSPCSHYGKTPPCTEAIIKSGIKKIHLALSDPNPLVKNSHRTLTSKGIKIINDISEKTKWQLFNLNYDFFKSIKKGLPAITLKYAMTLDGKIATYTFNSKWISNLNSRREVHRQRQLHDAVLIGANTFFTDNPSLNVRLKNSASNIDSTKPLVLIYFSYFKKKQGKDLEKKINLINIFKTSAKVVFLVPDQKEVLKKIPDSILNLVEIIPFNPNPLEFSLASLLKQLAKKFNLNSIYLEGGSRTQAFFFHHQLVDKVEIYLGNQILNDGGNALSPFKHSLLPVKLIGSVPTLKKIEYKKIINNMKISGWVDYGNEKNQWEKIWAEVQAVN